MIGIDKVQDYVSINDKVEKNYKICGQAEKRQSCCKIERINSRIYK